MRKIILSMSVSLDGYFEGPDRDIGWHHVDEELHQHFNDELGRMGAFLTGRVMHDLMAAFWPTADADPEAPGTVREFSRIWRDMPKIVYSRTVDSADWNATVVPEVVAEDVLRLKEQPGGDMSLGGADLAATFARLDLIDEWRLYVHPVLLGSGRPLFAASADRMSLRLLETRAFGNGVVLLRFDRPR